MSESQAKKHCIVIEENKQEDISNKLEKEAVSNRIYATRRLIKVNTEPPVYLSTVLALNSSVLCNIVQLHIKEPIDDVNEYGDKCIVCLPHDDIPQNTWAIFGLMIENMFKDTQTNMINNNTLDDLLYICFKYDIKFELIVGNKLLAGWSHLMLVIKTICDIKCKQYFPRTQNITDIKKYYDVIGNKFENQLSQYKTREGKILYLSSFEVVPTIHYTIMSIIAHQAL